MAHKRQAHRIVHKSKLCSGKKVRVTVTMPARPNLRHTLGFIGLSTIVYLALSFRGSQNSQQHVLPLQVVPDVRIARSTRIIAVGDLHGDIGNAQKVLEMARVVDSDGNWSGEVDIFVQTGDIIDRCVEASTGI